MGKVKQFPRNAVLSVRLDDLEAAELFGLLADLKCDRSQFLRLAIRETMKMTRQALREGRV